MMGRILVVEDSQELQILLQNALKKHDTAFASNLHEAKQQLKHHDFDLMLLDVMLPDGDGFKFCAELKNTPDKAELPVVFLTAKDAVEEKVLGLTLGAEDYITKPFDVSELKARVDVRMRKIEESRSKESQFQKGDLKFQLFLQRASIVKEGKETHLDLTSFEFKLLLFMAKHEDHVLNREQIIAEVWGNNINVLDRTIDSHMSNIRKKIHDSDYTVKAVYGSGYRFVKKTPSQKRG